MELSEKEAKTVLELTAEAWSEGQGSEGDNALVRRIVGAFPGLEVSPIVSHFLGEQK